jgi:hypothetical protein
MNATDYRAAVQRATLPLTGRKATPVWDASLRTAMEHFDRAIHEEQLVDQLIQDLVEPR